MFCSVSTIFSQVKGGRVIYQASTDTSKSIEKLNKNESIPKEFKNKMLYDLRNTKDIEFLLEFNINESIFYYAEKDDLENEGNRNNHTGMSAGANDMYYINLESKQVLMQSRYFNKLLIVQEPSVWEMTQETKKIGTYTCFKATTTLKVEGRNGIMYRSIVAWYTPQIPVSFGVQSFTGLPGLTLELKINNKTTYKAIKIELNPKEKVVIIQPKGKKISSQEFNDMLKGTLSR